MRKSIGLQMRKTDVIVAMGEGNPGAIRVMMEMMEKDPMHMFDILSLDDMNIRGAQIWVGYKDHCAGNLDNFTQAVKNRNSAMVDTINKEIGDGELAVTSGASFKR